jgi:hypothetical protein
MISAFLKVNEFYQWRKPLGHTGSTVYRAQSAGGKSGLHFNISSSVEFFFKLIMMKLEKQRVKIQK